MTFPSSPQQRRKVLPGKAQLDLHHILRRAFGGDLAALHAAFRPQVEDPRYDATRNNPFNAQGRPSRNCSRPPTAMLPCAGEGRWTSGKGVAGWSDALRESRARRAKAPRPRCAEVPSDPRASRAKVAFFTHQATLPNEDYHTEKAVLFPKIDRLDGFRAKRANPAFRQKTVRNISRLLRGADRNHPPHSKPITHAHSYAAQQSDIRREMNQPR